ncbi:AAA family ATPase [Promicromonospora sp. MS192]|uniref:AAA family ATPase n=1 Tax=Promicromonospora sp. MS192 TaxID=3412684 RepID=UPI003C30556A
MTRTRTAGGPYVREARADQLPDEGWPFTIPAVRALADGDALDLDHPVTLLCGDNGSGKSTILEAIADAAGLNAEGGSRNFQFSTRTTEVPLAEHLRLVRHPGRRPRDGFFLRAESYFNVASEIERLHDEPDTPPLLPVYGGISPHERSHGESFLDLVTHRFGTSGLYLLDEPEAALSATGCLALLARVAELAEQGSQFIIATHSPILLAIPRAVIHQLDDSGYSRIDYDDALPVVTMRAFLADPGRFVHRLRAD